ncbi:phenylalanine--tRNA ligase subunit alpha [Candidatus Marsarchaeota archaeon]|nr:phenylalanine--tRNA ligase subunit alpha [Candidatus Marsarchaeota archaeon]
MHEYEARVLEILTKEEKISISDLEKETKLPKDSILWTIESLSIQGALKIEKKEERHAELSEEGRRYLKRFPEEALIELIKKAGGQLALQGIKDQIGLNWAKKNGWIRIENGNAVLTEEGSRQISAGEYDQRRTLSKINDASGQIDNMKAMTETIAALSKRNLIAVKSRNVIETISITQKGKELANSPYEKGIGQLTRDAIKSRAWKDTGFRRYSVDAPAEPVYPARLHPLHEFINVVRRAWFEMGFTEVTGPIVESAFWNFDALFSPQDHPTRDMQDTFFLSNPNKLTVDDLEALSNVKKMHQKGWKEKWIEDIAKQAVLRTHMTSVSARTMRRLAKASEVELPAKIFSVGPVFRNESMDYKHVAQFLQYDGIVVGNGLTFSNLIATLKRFYAKLGMADVKFRPSYFPFTEPSLEAYYYDEEHNDTIELTGGGIIRKEITKALGTNKSILAWGGGVDRLLLNKRIFGLESLQTLYKNNIGWLRKRGRINTRD